MQEKKQFITFIQLNEHSITELCDLFEISRKTAYKWIRRYRQFGPAGLEEIPSRPRSSPYKTEEDIVDYVVSVRKKHPTWGGRKILQFGQKKRPELCFPSDTTINRIIRREGLSKKPRRRRKPGHPGKPIYITKAPNDLWTVDFKGQFKTGDGKYCYPLTIMDEHTRFVIESRGLLSTGYAGSIRVFREVFKKFGLPKAIKSDNGVPFATSALSRLSKLSVWWIELGIQPILTQPGCPSQNGVHERMHRTLKRECTIPPAANLSIQNRIFNKWIKEYNEERPHEFLKGETPSSRYKISRRPYLSKIDDYKYPVHFERRKVSTCHSFRWKSKQIHLSSTLNEKTIGLVEVTDGIWAIYFREKRIGFLDERLGKVVDTYGKTVRKRC